MMLTMCNSVITAICNLPKCDPLRSWLPLQVKAVSCGVYS